MAGDVFSANDNNLSKKMNLKATAVSAGVTLLGVALWVCSKMFLYAPDSSLYMFAMFVAITVFCVGATRLLFFGKEYVYKPTGSVVKQYSMLYKGEDLIPVTRAVEASDVASVGKLRKDDNAGLRLDILLSDDGKFASCQIFKWVPHSFEPASKVYLLGAEAASQLAEYVKKEEIAPVK